MTQPLVNAPAADSQLVSTQADNARFKLALEQWLLLHADDPTGVSFVEFAGHSCVVKRYRAKWFSPLIAGLKFAKVVVLSWLCWLLMGERPLPQRLLKNNLQDEAQRLVRLKDAGSSVPKVWYHAPEILVLEYVGQDMPYLIRMATPEGRLGLMSRAAQELANFHRAGFVHGGAQLRNLMVSDDGTATRIDFEENIGEALSLPLAQAYDVFVGEVTVASAVVTVITWYALMGRYKSATTATLPLAATKTSFSHNIGTTLIRQPIFSCVNTTTDNGYTAGMIVHPLGINTQTCEPSFIVDRNTVAAQSGASGASGWYLNSTTAGANFVLTAASWSYYMTAERTF